MTTLYSQQEDGSIQVIAGRKAWGVDIPAYAYDIWMPLIGLKIIAVYGLLWRLARDGKTKGMGLRKLARAARMGVDQLEEAMTVLDDCKWIKVTVGDSYIANSYEIFDPPTEISTELIAKYQLPSGYAPLTKWLVEEVHPDPYPNGYTPYPNGDSIIDPLIGPSSSKTSSTGKQSRQSKDPYRSNMLDKVGPHTGNTNTGDESKVIDYSVHLTSPLVQYVLKEHKKDTLTISKSLGEWLTQKQIVQAGMDKITYSSPIDLFAGDETFKEFVRERTSQFVNFPKNDPAACLMNICRFSHHDGEPDASGKAKMRSYHFWKMKFTAVVKRDNTPKPPVVIVRRPDWVEDDDPDFFEDD